MDDQRTEDWFAARMGKVTASRVADVMAKTKSGYSTSRQNYKMQLLCERLTGQREEGFTSTAMNRGAEMEPLARSAYEVESGLIVIETGLQVHTEIPDFAASPDGLIGSDGVLEIKVPNTAQHVEFLRTQKPDGKYQWQILAQMACTGRDYAHFVSWDDRLPEELQLSWIEFSRDQSRIDEMLTEIDAFLRELYALENEMRERIAARKAA